MLLTSACGGDAIEPSKPDWDNSGKSDQEKPAKTTPSPEAPAPPELPEAAQEPTDASAAQTMRYYFKIWNYGIDTGDWGPAEAMLADDACKDCTTLTSIPAAEFEGAHLEKRGGVSTGVDDDPYRTEVFMNVEWEKGSKAALKKGGKMYPFESGPWTLVIDLVWQDDRWLIKDYREEPV